MSHLVSYSFLLLMITRKCSGVPRKPNPFFVGHDRDIMTNNCTNTNYYDYYCKQIGTCEPGTHVVCMYYEKGLVMGALCEGGRMIKFTDDTKQLVLGLINDIRASMSSGTVTGLNNVLLPKPKNELAPLKWDKHLALFAQVWANQCRELKEDTCRATPVFPAPGQAVTLVKYVYQMPKEDISKRCIKKSTLTGAIQSHIENWYNHKEHVTPNMIDKYKGVQKINGIYSRNNFLTLVNGNTTHIGCGMSTFDSYKWDGSVRRHDHTAIELVCDFSAQPVAGEPVYEHEREETNETTTDESSTESFTDDSASFEFITNSSTNPLTNTTTDQPTDALTNLPSDPSSNPLTSDPTDWQSNPPTNSPNNPPTDPPTNPQSESPTNPSTDSSNNSPTDSPTNSQNDSPTDSPTNSQNDSPTHSPTNSPNNRPTNWPTNSPTDSTNNWPTNSPNNGPTNSPSNGPTNSPNNWPTNSPTNSPGDSTNNWPTNSPTNQQDHTATNPSSDQTSRTPKLDDGSGEPLAFANGTDRRPAVLVMPIIAVEEAPPEKYRQTLRLINEKLRTYSKKVFSSKNFINSNKLAMKKSLTSKKGSIFTRVPTFRLPTENQDSKRNENSKENVKILLEQVPRKDLSRLEEALKLLKKTRSRRVNHSSTISPLLNMDIYNEVNLSNTVDSNLKNHDLRRFTLQYDIPDKRIDGTDEASLNDAKGLLKEIDHGKETLFGYGYKTKHQNNQLWSKQSKVAQNSIRNEEKDDKWHVNTILENIKHRNRAVEVPSQFDVPVIRKQIPIVHAKERYGNFGQVQKQGYSNLYKNDKSSKNYIKDSNLEEQARKYVGGSKIALNDSKLKRKMYLENEIHKLKRKLQHLRQYIRQNDISENDRVRPVVETDSRRRNIKLKGVDNFYMPDRAHSLHEF